MSQTPTGYTGIPTIIETTFDNGNKLKLESHGGKWNIVHGEAILYDGEKAYMATTLNRHNAFEDALHEYCERLKKPFAVLANAV